jgi:hypothetical protein
MWLSKLFPDAQTVLNLEPEELAGVVLEHFNSANEQMVSPRSEGMQEAVGYPQQSRRPVTLAIAEAFWWLEREGLVIHDPDQPESWYYVTRRGRSMRKVADLNSYRNDSLLPAKLVHPLISSRIGSCLPAW